MSLPHARPGRWCLALPLLLLACNAPSRGSVPEGAPVDRVKPKPIGPAAPEVPSPAPPASTPPAPSTPPAASDPVLASHFVFIARARSPELLDCDKFDRPEAPHRRPPRPLHDATDYPERHRTQMEVFEVLQNPSGVAPEPPRALGKAEQAAAATLLFALGTEAFRTSAHQAKAAEYNADYCRRLNGWLSAPFLVVQAYPVYVDRGNSAISRLDAWESLGTDPRKGNQGFETLEPARAYARSLLKPGPSPAP